jgi:hypothetical protein
MSGVDLQQNHQLCGLLEQFQFRAALEVERCVHQA